MPSITTRTLCVYQQNSPTFVAVSQCVKDTPIATKTIPASENTTPMLIIVVFYGLKSIPHRRGQVWKQGIPPSTERAWKQLMVPGFPRYPLQA